MRRVACILAVAVLLVSGGTVAADAHRPIEYLALGDSLAFGYDPLATNPFDPNSFVGYPDAVATSLRDDLTNASCPGETSSHYLDLEGSDNGCGQWRAALPLHATYAGTQLAYADTFLQSHPKTLLVTLDMGANDLNVLIKDCGGRAEAGCILTGLPAMLATLSANLDMIYGHLRDVDGYHHKLVALTYPSLDYGDPLETGVVAQINQVVTARTVAWGGIVADGFGAWAAASAAYAGDTCAAGLRIPTPGAATPCDDHPTPAGHALLAGAIVSALRSD